MLFGVNFVLACYSGNLEEKLANTKLTLKLTLNASGQVTGVELIGFPRSDKAAESCMKEAIRQWQFEDWKAAQGTVELEIFLVP